MQKWMCAARLGCQNVLPVPAGCFDNRYTGVLWQQCWGGEEKHCSKSSRWALTRHIPLVWSATRGRGGGGGGSNANSDPLRAHNKTRSTNNMRWSFCRNRGTMIWLENCFLNMNINISIVGTQKWDTEDRWEAVVGADGWWLREQFWESVAFLHLQSVCIESEAAYCAAKWQL